MLHYHLYIVRDYATKSSESNWEKESPPPPTNDLVSVLLKNAVQAMLPGTINTWLCDEVDGKSRQEALVEAKTTKEVHKILSTVPPHPQNYPKHNEIWNKKRNKHSENDLVLMEK